MQLFGLRNEDKEDNFSTRKDGLPSKRKQDWEAVAKLKAQFKRFKVFAECKKEATDTDIKLRSLTTNDIATDEVTTDLLTAESKGMELVKQNVKERLVEKTVPFFVSQKRGRRHFQHYMKFLFRIKNFEMNVMKEFSGRESRIDVVFDQYRILSIKSATRSKRAGQETYS